MNGNEKFDEIKLPKKEEFYNLLQHEHVSNKDYELAKKINNEFEMKTMQDHHDLYLKQMLCC